MGLLSSIAAALSEGVGNGMVANAKWGIEEEAQRKKDEQENARNQKLMERYDADRKSREGIFAGQLEEMKNERLSRAEQAAADRENAWRIANIRASSSGGKNGLASPIKQLEMLDATIRGIDDERARLFGQMEGADPQTAKSLQVSIDALSSQRENLLNSGDANVIWSANGQIGAAHRSQFFANTEDKKTETSSTIPESLSVPPPSRPDANQSNWSGGDPSLQPQSKKTPAVQNNYGIWDRVSSDVSSLGSGLLNKMNNAYSKPLNR